MKLKKTRGVSIVLFFLLFLLVLTYLARPLLFQRAMWHLIKAAQSTVHHDVKKMNVPLISQTRNLNCEATTVQMILQYYGKKNSVDEIQRALHLSPDPHLGFRGDVDGNIWGFDDYGVYAEPIAKVMTQFGLPAKAYSKISTDFLKEKILAGKPAIIWIVISNPHPKEKYVTIDGEKVKLISGEHVAVVTGFENGTWILNDPWNTTSKTGAKQAKQLLVDDLDEIMWNDFDHMAVIVD